MCDLTTHEDVPRIHAIRKNRCHWPELFFLRTQLDAPALCAPKGARLSIGCDDIMKQCREVPTARVPLDYSRDTTARLAPETHRRALGTRMIFHPHPLPLFSLFCCDTRTAPLTPSLTLCTVVRAVLLTTVRTTLWNTEGEMHQATRAFGMVTRTQRYATAVNLL